MNSGERSELPEKISSNWFLERLDYLYSEDEVKGIKRKYLTWAACFAIGLVIAERSEDAWKENGRCSELVSTLSGETFEVRNLVHQAINKGGNKLPGSTTCDQLLN